MLQFDLFGGFVVTGYQQGFCHTCPPDIPDTPLKTPSVRVVNKEERTYPEGIKEYVCLSCEHSQQEKEKDNKTRKESQVLVCA
jgi:hypothetical protein